MTQAVDEARLGEFMGQMIGHMTGGALCFGIWLGDELGLYRALAGIGPGDRRRRWPSKAGCNARLVREWLDGQAAGGLVAYDASTRHATSSGPRRRWRSPTTARRSSSPGA